MSTDNTPSAVQVELDKLTAALPVGCRVRVVASDADAPEYVGAVGTVVDFDTSDGPHNILVGVRFNKPVTLKDDNRAHTRDGFHEEELVRLD